MLRCISPPVVCTASRLECKLSCATFRGALRTQPKGVAFRSAWIWPLLTSCCPSCCPPMGCSGRLPPCSELFKDAIQERFH